LPGSAIPQFADPLPALHTIVASPNQITLEMNEFQAPVLSTGTLVPGVAPLTWVWGYQEPNQQVVPSYIGPVIVATRGQPTEIKYANNLGTTATTHLLAYKNSTDQTLHWADPLNGQANMGNHSVAAGILPVGDYALNYAGPIPAAPHLHGGEAPPVLDGGPDAWLTSDGMYKGSGYYTKPGTLGSNEAIYRYPNSQESALIWFHDHTLGATLCPGWPTPWPAP
jgi:spore coat protein A